PRHDYLEELPNGLRLSGARRTPPRGDDSPRAVRSGTAARVRCSRGVGHQRMLALLFRALRVEMQEAFVLRMPRTPAANHQSCRNGDHAHYRQANQEVDSEQLPNAQKHDDHKEKTR